MPDYEITFLHPKKLDDGLPRLLKALADDIESISTGDEPSPELLATAPLLEDWRYSMTLIGVRLVGRVAGHPKLIGGMIMTSPLWVVDPKLRWARTTSRYYRLGVRSEDNDDDIETDNCKGTLR